MNAYCVNSEIDVVARNTTYHSNLDVLKLVSYLLADISRLFK